MDSNVIPTSMGKGKRTLGDIVQSRLGHERFERMANFRSRDLLSPIPFLEDTVRAGVQFIEKMPRNLTGYNTLDKIIHTAVTLPATAIRYVSNTSIYDWTVDAVAQNVTSFPFILNDKYAGGKTWEAALGTRATALVGNSIIGKALGDYFNWWMEHTDRVLHYKEDPNGVTKFLKYWAGATTAFLTGQSWGYALFLKGGDMIAGQPTDWSNVLTAVVSLSVLAPIIGPVQERGYVHMRRWFKPTPTAVDEQLQLPFTNTEQSPTSI